MSKQGRPAPVVDQAVTVLECVECTHRPSERFYVHKHRRLCPCPCHDVADAAPALLRACEEAILHLRGDAATKEIILAAIAQAEGKGVAG